ncbi:PIN domain-containing protein [Leptolyngbya sp. CCNP1308]|uniref:PIN domain-containing protein n=1 Tax=Leptolyngbya sp. CCNP1308 TaxID=3110255 RepID=UPI002B2212BB|nr:PIN domain-containing protein [Leptolyngbya sp. CCNP1308]MEA5447817.1 PIN domain-containing protein [Leptolyngbya sp. CCNP1308]
MNYMMLDTCVLLDISTRKSDLPVVSALEELVSSGNVRLLIPDIVVTEFARNKDNIANKTRRRLSQEFKQVRSVVEEFGGDNKDDAIEVLKEVGARLPLLSEANYTTISRVENLIENSLKVAVTDNAKLAALTRGLDKRAPFHISKNSTADAVIIEMFAEFVCSGRTGAEAFIFVTHNHNDFSSKDHREPHQDFAEIFSGDNVHYFSTISTAIKFLDEDILDDAQFEHDFTEETRSLQEILSAMDELVDKVWYNRHCNWAYHIEDGTIQIIPDDEKRYGDDVIHKSIWRGALAAAKKIEEKYEDTGPWDDFEWGMLNGKLSALRWVLGDEWDMLDT